MTPSEFHDMTELLRNTITPHDQIQDACLAFLGFVTIINSVLSLLNARSLRHLHELMKTTPPA
jgi:hypothetical protein